MNYLVVYEKGRNSFGAYVPDLPGCVAVAESKREVKSLIREAIQLHVEDLRARREPIPKATAASELVPLKLT